MKPIISQNLLNVLKNKIITHCDVASLYPSLMIVYDLLSRNVLDKNIYKEIKAERIKLKRAGDIRQQALKIILNELENSGFDVIYKVLTSLDYGVPQMRQRVYFIGINKNLNMNIELFKWPQTVEKPSLKKYLIDNNKANNKRLEILQYYLNNPTNNGKYTISDLEQMEGKILDTRMSDLRIYEERCPTLRSQRDGILYVRNGEIYQLTGYEALLLQGFPKEYADKVKDTVSDRHLLMQAGNAMTVNVINALGNSLIEFFKDV